MLHVIAEAGTNHGGKPAAAARLVDIARASGADSVKFQLIYPEGLYLPRLWRDGALVDNEVVQKRRAAMLSDDDWRRLAEDCRAKGIPFAASVFDRRGVEFMDALGVPYLKIASTDLNNLPLLRCAAERGRTMVISTGMSTLAEVERSVREVTAAGNRSIVLLHCVSVYPCPPARINLPFMTELKRAFGFPVGFSDHTESSAAAVAAVALGAEWIEKHFTYDRKAEGFDHAYAMEPGPFAGYVADLRAAAAALEPHAEKVGAAEAEVRKRARRSLYAARDLKEGERLAEGDVLVVRPEGELSPADLAAVVGRAVRRAVRAYEPITREAVGLP